MRGSVASFVVVGVVLAALVLGSIYVVKTQFAGKLQDDKTQVAFDTAKDVTDDVIGEDRDQNKSDASDDQAKKDEEKAAEEKAKADARAEEERAAKAKAEAEAKEQREAEEQAATSSNDSKGDTMPTTGVTTDEVEELPETGPTETFATVMAFGILAGLVVAYRRSVRAKA